MAHHEVVENNVKKELSYSLIGILAFLGVVLLILISAILRPAGDHVDVKALNANASAAASTATTANADTGTAPNTTVSSPDNASMTSSTNAATVAASSTISDRNASTTEAKNKIAEKTGETPNIAAPVASATASDATKAEKTDSKAGEALYTSTCKTCHEAGIAGAPKFGDAAAWKDRIVQGKDTLHKHAVAGFTGKTGVMPPKGGSTAADADVKAAVDYMVAKSS